MRVAHFGLVVISTLSSTRGAVAAPADFCNSTRGLQLIQAYVSCQRESVLNSCMPIGALGIVSGAGAAAMAARRPLAESLEDSVMRVLLERRDALPLRSPGDPVHRSVQSIGERIAEADALRDRAFAFAGPRAQGETVDQLTGSLAALDRRIRELDPTRDLSRAQSAGQQAMRQLSAAEARELEALLQGRASLAASIGAAARDLVDNERLSHGERARQIEEMLARAERLDKEADALARALGNPARPGAALAAREIRPPVFVNLPDGRLIDVANTPLERFPPEMRTRLHGLAKSIADSMRAAIARGETRLMPTPEQIGAIGDLLGLPWLESLTLKLNQIYETNAIRSMGSGARSLLELVGRQGARRLAIVGGPPGLLFATAVEATAATGTACSTAGALQIHLDQSCQPSYEIDRNVASFLVAPEATQLQEMRTSTVCEYYKGLYDRYFAEPPYRSLHCDGNRGVTVTTGAPGAAEIVYTSAQREDGSTSQISMTQDGRAQRRWRFVNRNDEVVNEIGGTTMFYGEFLRMRMFFPRAQECCRLPEERARDCRAYFSGGGGPAAARPSSPPPAAP